MDGTCTLGWGEVEALVARLAQAARAHAPPGGFERVVAVARGGLVPATLLAAALDIQRVESVQVRAYDLRQGRGEATLLGAPPEPAGPSGDPARTLLVDELLESGATLTLLGRWLPRATRAVLVVKGALHHASPLPPGPVEPQVLARQRDPRLLAACVLDAGAWVLFPWSPPQERAPA